MDPRNRDDGDSGLELNDQQLNDLLHAADSDLLDYLRATGKPGAGLTAMMDASASARTVLGRSAAQDAAVIIAVRLASRRILRLVEEARDLAGGLDATRTSREAAVNFIREISDLLLRAESITNPLADLAGAKPAYATMVTLWQELLEALASVSSTSALLGSAVATASDVFGRPSEQIAAAMDVHQGVMLQCGDILLRMCATGTVTRVNRDVLYDWTAEINRGVRGTPRATRFLYAALRMAEAVAAALLETADAAFVDAAGADLSGVEIPDCETLAGVLWTRETLWPRPVAQFVFWNSDEIRDGVFRVRGGNLPADVDALTG